MKILALALVLAAQLNAMDDEAVRHWSPRMACAVVGITFTYVLWGVTPSVEECGCYRAGTMVDVKMRPLGACEANCQSWCPATTMSKASCAPSKYFWEFLRSTNRTSVMD